MAAAARHVASYMGRFAPRCGYAGDTTCTTAAWTRPQLPHAPSGPLVILRRGIAMIPGDHSPGPADLSPPIALTLKLQDLESEEAVWTLYQRWCSFHDLERDRDDMVRRFVYFKDRAHKIIEFNKSGKSYTWGLNIFGDMTPQEQSELERPPLHRRI
uniref:Cathepsin propeptide inhibitor domain-containing protein n=1 Tax=Oryza meridionalis TaxID=40149 RepID=A0A0E0EJE6_9ORYZ